MLVDDRRRRSRVPDSLEAGKRLLAFTLARIEDLRNSALGANDVEDTASSDRESLRRAVGHLAGRYSRMVNLCVGFGARLGLLDQEGA